MNISRFARLAVSLAFVALVVVQAGGAAQAAPAGRDASVVTINVSAADQAAALAFWTPAAIARAKPLPMPVDHHAFPGRTRVPPAAPAGPGKPGFVTPAVADPNADSLAQKAFPDQWKDTLTVAGEAPALVLPADGTPGVYTSYTVNQWAAAWKVYPYKWVGRLSMKLTGGTAYCSATSFKNNTIVTAAHCIYDLDFHGYFNSWIFTPAYRNGKAPYGSFVVKNCTLLPEWLDLPGYTIGGATPYDLAVCSVGKNKASQTLNNSVGYEGYIWDWGYDINFHNLGYPWEDTDGKYLANAGEYLRLCTSESFYTFDDVLGMGCNWGTGMSGGSWMVGYAPSVASGYIDSVNSGIYPGSADIFGIRFSSDNIRQICVPRGCV